MPKKIKLQLTELNVKSFTTTDNLKGGFFSINPCAGYTMLAGQMGPCNTDVNCTDTGTIGTGGTRDISVPAFRCGGGTVRTN